MSRTMKTLPTRFLVATVLFALIAAALGCGGGGGGGGGTGGSTAPCLSYMPASAPGPSSIVTRSSGGSCGTLQLEFVATGVTDLFAASFRVTYDPAIMEYDSVSVAGSHLSSDGAQLQVLDATGAGMVDIDVSRIGTSTGIDFNGEVLIRLSFDRVQGFGSASFPLTLGNELLQDSDAPPVVIGGITWFGGTVELQ
jgi:hypothetical protein